MNFIDRYGNLIKSNISKPVKAQRYLKLGYGFQYLNFKYMKDKSLPNSLNYLSELCMKYTLDPMKNPDKAVFVNIFAPSEILHAFDLKPQLIEAMSSYFSGARCADAFIDRAESNGISDTLCSYHKTFIGAAMSKVVSKPRFAITTTTACDGNVNTFRIVCEEYGIDNFILDIPYEYSKKNEAYVTEQLRELVEFIEEKLDSKLDEEKLKNVLRIENKTLERYKEFLEILENKYFPNTITSEMYKVFTTHSGMGREDNFKFYEMLLEDIKNYKDIKPKNRIIWAHLLPFYSDAVKQYLDCNSEYQLLLSDINTDNMEFLDVDRPYESLAKKLINNKYNGPFMRRAENILEYSKKLHADAVINFCHWGCKEANGGAMILRDLLEKNNIASINIEGDAVDSRNSQEGQNKTRLCAFFEMMDNKKEENK